MLRSAPSFQCGSAPANSIDREGVSSASGVDVNCLFIGQNNKGCWVVRDRLGLKAGIFRSYDCALHFAKEEAFAERLSIVTVRGPLELGCD